MCVYSMCQHAVAIVEPRNHALLPETIQNAVQHTSLDWCVQVFHGPSTPTRALLQDPRVSFHDLGVDNLAPDEYNALLLDPNFWDKIHGNGKVLIMQTDSAFCGNARSPKLDDFPAYGFIGCSASVDAWEGKCRGIGGFSLRDKSTMQRCAQKANKDPPKNRSEDVYLAACAIEGTGKPMPSKNEDLLRFCVEYVEEMGVTLSGLRPPLGVHMSNVSAKTWDYVLDQCPSAKHLAKLR